MRTLIKINLHSLFAHMFMRSRWAKKRSSGMTALFVLLAIYVVGALMVASGVMFKSLRGPLHGAGYGWLYFSLMGIALFALCFISTIFAAQAQLFNARDNELLLSMPIRPTAILAGRLASLLALDYLFALFIALPAGAVWITSQPVGFVQVVFFILAVLLVPLAALAFACFFAWIIALITARMRNKNIFSFILSLLFLGGYFWVYSNMSRLIQTLITSGAEIAEAIRSAVFPIYHLGVAIEEGRAASMFIAAVFCIAPFVLALAVLSANFIKIATTNRGAARVRYKEKPLRASGVRWALIVKELRYFAANPMIILNTALGAVFMLALSVFLAVRRQFLLDTLSGLSAAGLYLTPATVACAGLSLLAAMCFVSAPSVSLEGSRLWIAKSLPVSPADILLSKAYMHMLVCGLPAAVSAIICAVVLEATVPQLLLLLIVPLALTAFVACAGVVINLQFPRFDWINPLQPVKQGMSTLLSMFGFLALMGALALLYALALAPLIGLETYLLLCALLFAALAALLARYLKRGGSRRFEALTG